MITSSMTTGIGCNLSLAKVEDFVADIKHPLKIHTPQLSGPQRGELVKKPFFGMYGTAVSLGAWKLVASPARGGNNRW